MGFLSNLPEKSPGTQSVAQAPAVISISTTGPWRQKCTRQLALTATSLPQLDHGVLAVGHVLSTVRLLRQRSGSDARIESAARVTAFKARPSSYQWFTTGVLTATSERCKTGALTTTFGPKLDPGFRAWCTEAIGSGTPWVLALTSPRLELSAHQISHAGGAAHSGLPR